VRDSRSSSDPRPRSPRRAKSGEDDALFRHAMRDVTPLADRKARPVRTPSSTSTPGAEPNPTLRRTESPPDLPTLDRGAAAGVDARTLTRLKRGQIRPQATLDLHGMTRDHAHRALAQFLARAQRDGRRCVIVVTGKGRLAEGGGVLRAELPHWLNLAVNRPRILGFAEAQPRDGGAGAVYVLLRRARSRE